MINLASNQVFFPSSSQNYNQNKFPSSSKMLNVNLTGFQNANGFIPKSNSHKKLSAILLTDQNVDINNMQKAMIDTPQIIKAGYNNAYSMNKKLSSIFDYKVKFSSAQKIGQPSENFNFLNFQNSAIKGESKKDYTLFNTKISDELVINNDNYYTPRIDRPRKNYQIPHPPSVKKRLADAFNQYATNKYNTNYNEYNSQYLVNQVGSNCYNTTLSQNLTDNLKNILNSSADNLTLNNVYFEEEPKNNFKLSDFTILNEIGKGAEGIIYVARWKRNNKKYALKKIQVTLPESIKKRKEDNEVIKNFIETTGCDSIIKPIASTNIKNEVGIYDLYEIIELAQNDWEKEIEERSKIKKYYTEPELMKIFKTLINTFYLLQEHHITHRDIKPQNILVVNGKLKICDFGNARILKRQGVIIQRIRGSELFMSPIVFEGYRAGKQNIRHNAYKSDVFSLGMCFFLAACLSYNGPNVIRLLYDMNTIKRVLNYNLSKRYSESLINMLWTMLQVDEKKRPDFLELKALYP
jgi:tRNA A-37 threonylcarbamoyl transferase component Bud32